MIILLNYIIANYMVQSCKMAIQSQNTLLRLTFLFKTHFFLNKRLQYNVINFCEKLYSK